MRREHGAQRASAESLTSSTANASATGAIVVPTRLTLREAKYQRKFRSRSGANDVLQSIGPPVVVAAAVAAVVRVAPAGPGRLPGGHGPESVAEDAAAG